MRAGSSTRIPPSRPRPRRRERGGLEAMPLEPAFLFSHELLQNALPELLSQTGTSGPAIRAVVDPRLAGDAPQQFSRHRARGRGVRQAADAACRWSAVHGDLQAPSACRSRWFDGDAPQARRRAGALALRGARHGAHQQAPARPGGAPEVRTGVFHRPQDAAQRRRRGLARTARRTIGRRRVAGVRRRHGRAGRAVRLARFRVQFFCRRAAVPARAVPALPDARGASAVVPATSSA